MAVFLYDDATQEDIDEARTTLLDIPGVTAVDFVSREEALRRAQRDFPDFQEVFGSLEVNPLPRSLEVSVRGGQGSASTAEEAWQTAVGFPFVEDADYGSDWVSNLTSLRRIAGIAAAVLGFAFAVVAALITASAMRITIFARRDEIYVMRLVGSARRLHSTPFHRRGRSGRYPRRSVGVVVHMGRLPRGASLPLPDRVATHRMGSSLAWWRDPASGMASSLMAVRGRLGGMEQ